MSPAEGTLLFTWQDTAQDYNKDVGLSSRECVPRLLELASSLSSLSLSDASVIEFGAGTGSLTLPLASLYPRLPILATDISDAMLAQLQTSCVSLPNVSTLNIDQTQVTNYHELQHRKFSHVFSSMALQTSKDPLSTIREWKALLEPSGVIAVAIWAFDNGCSLYDIWDRSATRADPTYVPPTWTPQERWPTLRLLESGINEAGFVDVVSEKVPVGFSYGLEALIRFYWESQNPMCTWMRDSYGERDLNRAKEEMARLLQEDYDDGWNVPLDAGLVVARLPVNTGV